MEFQEATLNDDYGEFERQVVEKLIDRSEVESMLARLTPRQERILRMYYGIGYEKSSTKEIAEEFYVTQSQIYQILKKARKRGREILLGEEAEMNNRLRLLALFRKMRLSGGVPRSNS